MPRSRRVFAPGTVQHVISRFLDREFRLVDDVDRNLYLQSFEKLSWRGDWTWLSFAAMSTHIHHGAIAGHTPLAAVLHPVHTRFAFIWHKRHGGLGPVFASRPKAHILDSGSAARMIAYHHRNPVMAGVVKRPRDSTWTSHRYYLRLAPAPSWLSVERGLALCGFSDTAAGRRAFDEFVCDAASEASEALAQKGAVLVTNPFERRSQDLNLRKSTSWKELLQQTEAVMGLPILEITKRSRTTSDARMLLLWAATRHGMAQSQIAGELGISRAAVSHALRQHVNRREALQPKLQELLARLRERGSSRRI